MGSGMQKARPPVISSTLLQSLVGPSSQGRGFMMFLLSHFKLKAAEFRGIQEITHSAYV